MPRFIGTKPPAVRVLPRVPGDNKPLMSGKDFLGVATEGLMDRAAREFRSRRVQAVFPTLVKSGTGGADDPILFGRLGALVEDLLPLFVSGKCGPDGKKHTAGPRAGLIGNPLILMTSARRANPRGSTDAVQRDLLAKDGATPGHFVALKRLHALMAASKGPVTLGPYGFVRESSSGPFSFVHGADKRPLHDALLDALPTFEKMWRALVSGKVDVASRHMIELALAGVCFSSADGERQQLNRVAYEEGSASPFHLVPGKQRFGVTWMQEPTELFQDVRLTFIPEGATPNQSEMADGVTSKPRLVHMKGIGANGPDQMLHRPHWDAAVVAIKKGVSPSQSGLEVRGHHFFFDVRQCDKRLPWNLAVEAVRSRVEVLGMPPITAALNVLMMNAPAFVFADSIGEAGAATLGTYGDLDTWSCYPGNPSGIADNSDKNVEGCLSDWAVRLAADGIASGPEGGMEYLWNLLTHDDPKRQLNQRGDGFHARFDDPAECSRVRAAIARDAKDGEVYDNEPADEDAFDGHHLTSGGWFRDVVSLLGKIIRPERSIWTKNEATRPACPGQGLELRLEMIRSVPGGDEVIALLDKHFAAIHGPVDEYAAAMRLSDRLPQDLTPADLAVLNDPSSVGRPEYEGAISPAVLEQVKTMYSAKEVADATARLSLDLPLPPAEWR